MFMVYHHMYHLQLTYYQAKMLFEIIRSILDTDSHSFVAHDGEKEDLEQLEYVRKTLGDKLDRG